MPQAQTWDAVLTKDRVSPQTKDFIRLLKRCCRNSLNQAVCATIKLAWANRKDQRIILDGAAPGEQQQSIFDAPMYGVCSSVRNPRCASPKEPHQHIFLPFVSQKLLLDTKVDGHQAPRYTCSPPLQGFDGPLWSAIGYLCSAVQVSVDAAGSKVIKVTRGEMLDKETIFVAGLQLLQYDDNTVVNEDVHKIWQLFPGLEPMRNASDASLVVWSPDTGLRVLVSQHH